MLIDFVHTGDAYLPELPAYEAFLRQAGHGARIHRTANTIPADARVLWWLCGRVDPALAQRHATAIHVHEYASASVPPWAWLKDRIKRWRQPRPDYRIFQNDWVRQRMGFADATPWALRDMGIAPVFWEPSASPTAPKHDFVYLGEMRRLRHFLPLFEALAQIGKSVLLIGELPDDLVPLLLRQGHVQLTGRVPQEAVPALLRRARHGLNLVPDRLPYTRQTSTKLLEYCAAGLPVVSTEYAWVRDFERTHEARFAYVPAHAPVDVYATLLGPALATMPLRVPDVRHLVWPELLRELEVWSWLEARTCD